MGNSSSESLETHINCKDVKDKDKDVKCKNMKCRNCEFYTKHIEDMYIGVEEAKKICVNSIQKTHRYEKETHDKIIKQCQDSILFCDMTIDYIETVNKHNIELVEVFINEYKEVLQKEEIKQINIEGNLFLFNTSLENVTVEFIQEEDIVEDNSDKYFKSIAEFYKYLLKLSSKKSEKSEKLSV